ncbi:MAG: gamma-glutamyltransferase [Calditrichaeota bacterium]|nr:gamma-glutamyltransferase [Calditrichota bacterium]
MKSKNTVTIVTVFLLLFLFVNAPARYISEARGKQGMVVSSEETATRVGVDVLKKGGNAIDAAIAVGFALAVTYPTAGNIGGGGFMVISFPDGRSTTIDFRETAPLKASRDMYLDADGKVIPGKSTFGYAACGVPGTVAGLTMALKKYGTMPLKKLLQPALALAKNGLPVSYQFHRDLLRLKNAFSRFPSSKKVFFKKNGEIYEKGDIFRQPDLYSTLKRIAKHGAKGFYEGKTAKLIVRDMEKNHGLITLKDLRDYRAIERRPVIGQFHDYEVISMGLPSSGGICLIQAFNILEKYDLKQMGWNSSQYLHLLTETLKNIFAVRAHFLGDADFVKVPIKTLISKNFAQKIAENIQPDRAVPAAEIPIANPFQFEGNHTTHYNVVDKNGMAVAVTYTINSGYGAKAVVDGAGFLLNNEMDDFAIKAGNPNIYKLVAFAPNLIEPGKRMLSSMSPTIMRKNGKFFMAVGAMGGPKIITATLQTILNVIVFDMSLQEAINAPRIHHQWLPDKIFVEKMFFPSDVLENLRAMGHTVETMGYHSEVTAILFQEKSGELIGAPDFRWNGKALGF